VSAYDTRENLKCIGLCCVDGVNVVVLRDSASSPPLVESVAAAICAISNLKLLGGVGEGTLEPLTKPVVVV